MFPDKMPPPEKYILPDPDDGGLRSVAPLGFTGQGCIWYASEAPAGWLICDGSLVNKETYPELWQLLGDTWGTSTTTQFYLPDLRQRVPVGKHSSGTFAALNGSGGAETHTLTTAQMPAHNHSLNPSSNYLMGGAGTNANLTTGGGGYVYNGVSIGNTGGGGAHNNLQPYRVVNFIIKT